jgi:uncharacterized caspase-like protein
MGARMGNEGTSLTEAVKDTAGISLTRAVKDAAGRGTLVLEEVLDAEPGMARRILGWLIEPTGAAGARLAAVALLALVFLNVTPTPVRDSERASPGLAHKRVALVIGNSAYRYSPRLENPRNDAADMSVVLGNLGFRVVEGFDLGKTAFDAKVREFSQALEGAQVALFFYAGHGIQVSGQNYLVPIDAKLSTAAALEMEMVRLELVHKAMEREAHTSLLFFDACRDNPLARSLARSMGFQSPDVGQGLAAIESGAGTLISFSTQPGNVALDGKGRNSPFSGALVRRLAASSEDLNAILIAVRNDVMRQTDRRQVPWEHSALTRRFYFSGSGDQPVAGAPLAQLRLDEAADAWSAINDTSNLAVVDAFAARFSETIFADLARARAQQLRSGMVQPPPPQGEASALAP